MCVYVCDKVKHVWNQSEIGEFHVLETVLVFVCIFELGLNNQNVLKPYE